MSPCMSQDTSLQDDVNGPMSAAVIINDDIRAMRVRPEDLAKVRGRVRSSERFECVMHDRTVFG